MTGFAQVGLGTLQTSFMRESSARVNILEGSIRSGKTIVSLLRWLIFVAGAPRGGELVMIGRTRDAIYRNVIKPLQDPSLFGPLAALTVYTNGSPTATIMGRTVHIIGASDAKAEKVIRGMTVAGAYVDEVTVIPEEFFTQLLGRMSVRGAQLFGTTNPDSPAHWLKRRFLDRIAALPDWRSWHFTIDDNPSLTESYKAAIRAEFTGLWYRRFILGAASTAGAADVPAHRARTRDRRRRALRPRTRPASRATDLRRERLNALRALEAHRYERCSSRAWTPRGRLEVPQLPHQPRVGLMAGVRVGLPPAWLDHRHRVQDERSAPLSFGRVGRFRRAPRSIR